MLKIKSTLVHKNFITYTLSFKITFPNQSLGEIYKPTNALITAFVGFLHLLSIYTFLCITLKRRLDQRFHTIHLNFPFFVFCINNCIIIRNFKQKNSSMTISHAAFTKSDKVLFDYTINQFFTFH